MTRLEYVVSYLNAMTATFVSLWFITFGEKEYQVIWELTVFGCVVFMFFLGLSQFVSWLLPAPPMTPKSRLPGVSSDTVILNPQAFNRQIPIKEPKG